MEIVWALVKEETMAQMKITHIKYRASAKKKQKQITKLLIKD